MKGIEWLVLGAIGAWIMLHHDTANAAAAVGVGPQGNTGIMPPQNNTPARANTVGDIPPPSDILKGDAVVPGTAIYGKLYGAAGSGTSYDPISTPPIIGTSKNIDGSYGAVPNPGATVDSAGATYETGYTIGRGY